MTRNQIELIKARETERANRAQEELASQGHQVNVAGSILRGLGSTLLPKTDTIVSGIIRGAEQARQHNNTMQERFGNRGRGNRGHREVQ